ncbi:hypothetical protein [Bacillus toyonensis]|nr:hypothetical protein [Bacillus toyonensis]
MRTFSIMLLSITSAFTIMLSIGITEKENATSKVKDVEYAQYMSREPGGH